MAEVKDNEKRVEVEAVGVFANYKDVVTSLGGVKRVVAKSLARGETAEIPESEAERLKALGGVVDPGTASATQDAALDAYRAARGDQDALARVIGSGGTPEEAPSIDVAAASDEELAAHIADQKLNVSDTVGLAGDNPELAEKVLAAESSATGGKPRKGVEDDLRSLSATE